MNGRTFTKKFLASFGFLWFILCFLTGLFYIFGMFIPALITFSLVIIHGSFSTIIILSLAKGETFVEE